MDPFLSDINIEKIGNNFARFGDGLYCRIAKIEVMTKEGGSFRYKFAFLINDDIEDAYPSEIKGKIIADSYLVYDYPEEWVIRLDSPIGDKNFYNILPTIHGKPTRMTELEKSNIVIIKRLKFELSECQRTISLLHAKLKFQQRKDRISVREQVNTIKPYLEIMRDNKVREKVIKKEKDE